jgi:hypothetical protein
MVETDTGSLRGSRTAARGSRASLLVLSVLLASVVAGCGSPAGGLGRIPPLGPNDILATSIVRLAAASSLHVKASVGGSLNASALSSLAGGLPVGLLGKLKLDGSSVTGEVDIARRAAHLSASFPVLFGTTADVIVVDGRSYTKVSLLGDKYRQSTLPSSYLAVPGPGPTFGQTEAMASVLAGLSISGATATLLGTDSVEGRPAYHLTLDLPAAGLVTIMGLFGGGAGSPGLEVGQIGYWVYVDTMQPARMTVSGSAPALGDLNVDATIDGYGVPVIIAAPPAGQVSGG